MPITGNIRSDPSCCALFGSFTRLEIITPRPTARKVNIGVSNTIAISQVG